ncbi:MAG: S9 family peptidase, partial [Gaiellaceae bacterium]
RVVVVERAPDGSRRVLTPAGFNVRTRVHEYGGGECWYHGDRVFFSDFVDGRLYRLDGAGATPLPLTPEPAAPHALRYSDGCVTPGGDAVYCVRERHEGGAVENELVRIAVEGVVEPVAVVSGRDFVAAPRLDPAGRRLAWLVWDHPQMPWDGTELWTAELDGQGRPVEARLVAGGPGESIFQPEWSADGVLHFCTDRTGWWNLAREVDGGVEPLTQLADGEIGHPAWAFALRCYAFVGDGRVVCRVTRSAVDSLELLDPGDGTLSRLENAWTSYSAGALAADSGRIAFAAASPASATTLVELDLATAVERPVRRSLELELDPASISVPRAVEYETGDGGVAHAFYYPPTSSSCEGLAGERPPLRVICHGGPTAHTLPYLNLKVQFFTQRGIGVVDVNHRGSSGFGRAYRRLLDGRWGELDRRDCIAAARHLAEQGDADPARTWIEGGSAGGYVVFCCLVFEPGSFAAGVSYFGVSDLEALARETHKFESHYMDTLIAPYPERADLYRERSPIHFAERLERPLLLLQGLDDEVVPAAQAELLVEVLAAKGIPYAYLAFEGEGHGLRTLENIRRALEATLSFVGQVFGFEPAGDVEAVELVRRGR